MEFNQTLSILIESAPLLMRGALMTAGLWLGSAAISLILGTAWGLMLGKRVKVPVFSRMAAGMAFVVRAVPFYVQLLIVYFALPLITGINLSAVTAGIASLGVCSAGYVAYIVCTGLNAISQGQWEACYVLGYSRRATLRYCIMPQMVRIILPALINEGESLLKSTALISSIGVLELTRVGMNVVSRYMNPLSMYAAVAVVYVVFSLVLGVIAKGVQRRLGYGNR